MSSVMARVMASSFASSGQVQVNLPDVSDSVSKAKDQSTVEVLKEPKWCCEVLSSLLRDPSTHNVVFVTSDGGNVSGHKAILAAGSPVFRAMFTDNVCTGSEGEMEIPVPSVDTETFTSLLSYIYTGKVAVNSATCLDMLGAAMHFKITSLVTKLTIFIAASLDSNKVISVTTFACERNCSQLLDSCLKYMCANASDVIQDPDFIKLSHEVVLEFCKSSDLNVSEIDLFLAVCEWQKHNQKVARAVIKNIFREIRYPLIPNVDLVSQVAPTEMADSSLYITALEFHVNESLYKGPRSQLVPRRYCPAPPLKVEDEGSTGTYGYMYECMSIYVIRLKFCKLYGCTEKYWYAKCCCIIRNTGVSVSMVPLTCNVTFACTGQVGD